jgi:hypothetical protein
MRIYGRALKECVKEHDWEESPDALRRLVGRFDLSPLVTLAEYHGVLNFLYLSVRGLEGADPAFVGELERHYKYHIGHHLRALADLASLGDVLDGHEIPWITFKGPVLAEVVYPRSDLRTYSDLDVLIPRAFFGRAIELLERNRCRLVDTNWNFIRDERLSQLHMVLRLGTVADAHWHLLNSGKARDALRISTDEILERSRTVALDGRPVRTLDSVDTLVHLCIHAGFSGGRRLLWLKDVDRAVGVADLSWDEVVRRAEDWRAGAMVSIVLQRVARIMGTPIPSDVIRTLSRSPIRRAGTSIVDVVSPPEASLGRTTPSVLWARTARDSWAATVVALVRRATGRFKRYLRQLTTYRRATSERRTSKEILVPSGGAEGRAAYFRAVAEGFDLERRHRHRADI